MKTIKSVLIGALVALLGSSAWADGSVKLNGQTISWTGEASEVSGGSESTYRTIQFTSGSGTLKLPATATATFLVVGGGGGGAGSYFSSTTKDRRYGAGGNGGDVIKDREVQDIPAQTLSITVGAGGNGGTRATSQAGANANNGSAGNYSSVTGTSFTELRADGGAGGARAKSSATAGTPTVAQTSTIVSGNFGKGGDSNPTTSSTSPSAGAANTGTGGQGGNAGSSNNSSQSQNRQAGANGGSGIVVVKITAIADPVEVIDCGDVFISHGQTLILTNDQGQAILWSKVTNKTDPEATSNANIAQLVSSNDTVNTYAAVTNPVRDGTAKLVVAIEGTNYNYTVHAMTVEIEKTVKATFETDKNDRSNATIRVTTHVLYGVHEIPTNKILFVGSLCQNHDLDSSVIPVALTNLAKKGSVDYYLYDYISNEASKTANRGGKYAGHIEMSANPNVPEMPAIRERGHRNLAAYLTLLDEKLGAAEANGEGRTYDYIILDFDGTRLASDLTVTDAHRSLADSVAGKLKWYYDNDRVIWLVDPAPGSGTGPSGVPENADDPYYKKDTATKQYYYTPSSFYYSSGKQNLAQANWELLVAILDPATYAKGAGNRYVEIVDANGVPGQTKSGNTYWGVTKNELQATYEDPGAVAKVLDDYVKLATYDTELVDNVLNLNKSLSIVPTGMGTKKKEVHFYTWKGEKAPETYLDEAHPTIADLDKGDKMWAEEPDSAFGFSPTNGYEIIANVSNITMETWNMFEISIVDNGTFLQECIKAGKAEYDEKTGKYKVDPNDGPAHVTLYSMEGGQKYEVQAAAKATTVLWPFDLIPLKIYVDDATVTYGDDVPTTLGWKSGAARYDLPNVDASKINGLNTVTFGTTYTKGSPVGSGYTINTNSAALSSTYYAITVVPGQLTVKQAKIDPVEPEDPGDNPDDEPDPTDGPTIWARNVEKRWDGVPTNIVAKVYNILPEDEAGLSYEYTTNDLDAASWKANLSFTDPVVAQKVYYRAVAGAGANYIGTNCYAYVTIFEREADVEGEDNVGNAKEIEEELVKNAEKYRTAEYPYVKLRVTVTKAEEVPDDGDRDRRIRTTKTEADRQADAIVVAASAKAQVAKSEIKADLYDLVLERTYDKAAGDALDHDRSYDMSKWDDIGANGNNDLYKFEFDYNKPDGYDLVGVYKYHNGASVWLSAGAGQADHYTITWKGGKQVLTMWFKEFCVGGACFAPHIEPPPPPPKHEQTILYPNGDGDQCICDRPTGKYVGTVWSDEEGVIGTLELTTKPKKGGSIDIKAKLVTRIDGNSILFEKKDVPACESCGALCPIDVVLRPIKIGCDCLPARPEHFHELALTIDGDSIMGLYDGYARVDIGRDVFATKKDPKAAAAQQYVGTWTGAFAVSDDVGDLGTATYCVDVKKNGKVTVTGTLPDGLDYKCTTKMHVGTNDFCVIPVMLSKLSSGTIKSIGYRILFDTELGEVRIDNVSPWQGYVKRSKEVVEYATLESLGIGCPEVSKKAFATMSVTVRSDDARISATPDKTSLKVNAKTGRITGKLVWYVVDEDGKRRSYTGTAKGVIIGEDGIGTVTVPNVGSFAMILRLPAE